MPYRRKYSTRYRRKSKTYTKNKRSIQKSKSASSQQKQLLSLQRQVKTLAKHDAYETQYTTFGIPQQPITLTTPNTVVPTFQVFRLTEPANWLPIFSTDQRVLDQRKACIKGYNLHIKLSPTNSLVTLTQADVQMWLVKLKPESSQQLLIDTNNLDQLSIAQAPQGLYWYCNLNDSGYWDHVRLNPKYFDIKAYRFRSLQNIMQETETIDEDVDVTSPSNVKKFLSIKHRCSTVIENVRGDPRLLAPEQLTESWSVMDEQQVMPNDRYYLITHVGGYASQANSVDLQANWTVSVKTQI